MLPVCLLTVPSSVAVSVLTSRLGRFRWAIWGGWAITTLACGLQILLDVDSTTVITSVFLAVLGIGMGMVLTSLNVGIQAISKPEDAAMAASMYGFLRSLGMPLGVAVSSAVSRLPYTMLTHPSSQEPFSQIQCQTNFLSLVCLHRSLMTPSSTSSSYVLWPTLLRRVPSCRRI